MIQWFQSLIYGLLCGFTELLPVSSQTHGILLQCLFGISDLGGMLRIAVHLGVLLSLLLLYRPQIRRLNRERKIAAVPPRRRKRRPDPTTLLELKMLRTATVPMLLGFAVYPWVADQGQRLWFLGLALVLNGIVLYAPQFLPQANKDARNLSVLDSLLIGISGALAVIPGISRVGMLHSSATMRGTDRQYALQTTLLLCIAAIAIQIVIDLIYIFLSVSGVTFAMMLCTVTACAAAIVSSYFSILFIRFLAVNAGLFGFAYYSWGAAMLAFILYLAI